MKHTKALAGGQIERDDTVMVKAHRAVVGLKCYTEGLQNGCMAAAVCSNQQTVQKKG